MCSPARELLLPVLVSSRHHHNLRAGSPVVEYVEVRGEGRGSTRKGELHAIGATCVLSQRHCSVQAGALRPGSAVGQHLEVGAPVPVMVGAELKLSVVVPTFLT